MMSTLTSTLRTVTSEDLYKFQWPSTPVISPDGKQVVYEKTIAKKSTNGYETHLWLSDIGGQSRKVLTSEGNLNTSVIWSPDGKKIAYLSNEEFGTQVWVLSLESGEKKRISQFKRGISSILYSPDGETIYGLVPVKLNEEIEVFQERDSDDEAKQWGPNDHIAWKNAPKRYSGLYYKLDGTGLQKNLKLQLVSIDAHSGSFSQVTNAAHDVTEPAISPDGKYLLFSSISSDNDNILYKGELNRISVKGGEAEKLYDSSKVASPSYSPDGKWISFIGGDMVHRQLLIIPADGGESISLSDDYPDTLADLNYTDMRYIKSYVKPQWSKDNRFIYALTTHQGTNEVVRFSVSENGGQTTVVGGQRAIFHFAYDGDETVVAAYSSPSHPGKITANRISEEESVVRTIRNVTDIIEVYNPIFPKNEVRIDDCNDELLSELNVVEPETFSYESVDGWQIQGFLLKPANVEPGKKYPVLLEIHGGPHSMYGYTYFHQLQLISAQGYGVVFTNPRGSSGFGREFTEAVQGDYGGKDMQDILNGVKEAVTRYDFLDGERVAVNGLSYGGFMTNWLVTHTDRFFAAITEGCISNWVSFFGTSDIVPGFISQEFLGKTDPESLWKLSPLAYVENVQTPLLIVHAEDDLRCPIEQAEQFYSYIKRQGKEVEFLRIPNASHGMLQNAEPENRIARVEAMVDWINTHLPE